MPAKPSDEEANGVKACLWYGWMMARADDVHKIFDVLDMVGIRHTPKGDSEMRRLVRALDAKHKFQTIDG